MELAHYANRHRFNKQTVTPLPGASNVTPNFEDLMLVSSKAHLKRPLASAHKQNENGNIYDSSDSGNQLARQPLVSLLC
jgi:hypothetical protein